MVIAALSKKNQDMKALVEKSIKEIDLLNEKHAKDLLLRNEEIKRQEELKKEEAVRIEQANAERLKDLEEKASAQKERYEREKLETQKAIDEQNATEQALLNAPKIQEKNTEKEILLEEPTSFSTSPNAWNEASALLEKTMHIKKIIKPAIKKDSKLSMSFMKYKMAVKVSIGQMTKSRQKLFGIAIAINERLTDSKKVSNDFSLLVMDMTAKSIIVFNFYTETS